MIAVPVYGIAPSRKEFSMKLRVAPPFRFSSAMIYRVYRGCFCSEKGPTLVCNVAGEYSVASVRSLTPIWIVTPSVLNGGALRGSRGTCFRRCFGEMLRGTQCCCFLLQPNTR